MAKKLVKYKYQTLSLFLNSMNSAYRVSKCLACGSTNYQKLEIGQLCSNCGVVLASPERFCSLCGEKIESFSTSCLNCSANFSDNFEIKEETNEHLDAYFSKIVSDIILTAKKLEVKKYPIDFTYWHLFLASTVKWYPTLDYLLSKNASKTVFSYFGIKKVKSLEKLVDEFYKLIQKIDIENGEEDITSLIKIIPLVPILAVAVWKKLGRASSEEILLYSGDKSKSRNFRDLVCEFLEFYTVKILDTVSSFIDKKIVGSRAALLETVVNNSFSMVLITTILTQLQYKVEFIPKAVQLHASALVSFAFHLGEVADKETKPVFVSFAKNGLKTVLSFIQNFIKRKNLFIVSGSLLFYSKFLADFASKLDEDFLFEINESLLEKINEFEFEGRLIDFAQTFDIVHFILAGIWSLANTSDNFQYREKIKDLTRTLINRTVLANPRFSIDETFFPQIVELIALTSYDYEYLEETILNLASFFERDYQKKVVILAIKGLERYYNRTYSSKIYEIIESLKYKFALYIPTEKPKEKISRKVIIFENEQERHDFAQFVKGFMPIKEEELEKITQILTPYGFKVVNKTTLGPRCELDGEIDHILFQFEYIFDNAPMLNYLQFDKFHLGPEHTITVKAEKLAELCKNIQFESLVTSVENLRISSNIPIEAVVLCTEHNKNVEGLLLIPNVVKRQSSMLEDGTVDSKRDRFIIYEFEVYGLLKTKEIVRTEIDYLIEILDNWMKKEKIKGAIFTIPPYEKIQHLIAEEEKTNKQVYLEEE